MSDSAVLNGVRLVMLFANLLIFVEDSTSQKVFVCGVMHLCFMKTYFQNSKICWLVNP